MHTDWFVVSFSFGHMISSAWIHVIDLITHVHSSGGLLHWYFGYGIITLSEIQYLSQMKMKFNQ